MPHSFEEDCAAHFVHSILPVYPVSVPGPEYPHLSHLNKGEGAGFFLASTGPVIEPLGAHPVVQYHFPLTCSYNMVGLDKPQRAHVE